MRIIGVRIGKAQPVLYFDAGDEEVEVGDRVVVETERGLMLGRVVIAPSQVLMSETEPPKKIVRKATEEDIKAWEEIEKTEKETLLKARELAKNTPIKIIKAQYSLDKKLLTLYFIAEKRVDLRKLLKKMREHFGTKVEMKQVGVRDGAKLVGGMGICGRELCCSLYLDHFESITLKMAKEQNLPLNPEKISGVCGRLLCCLEFDHPLYREMKEKMPKKGSKVMTPYGEGKVVEVFPLTGKIKVETEDGAVREIDISEMGNK